MASALAKELRDSARAMRMSTNLARLQENKGQTGVHWDAHSGRRRKKVMMKMTMTMLEISQVSL